MALEKMQAIRQARAEFFVTYFDFLQSHSRNFAKNLMVLDAAEAFVAGFDDLRGKKLTPAEQERLGQYYATQFLPLADRFSETPTPLSLVSPTNEAARFLHFQYIAGNPNPPNSKHLLQSVDDGTAYARAHTKYQGIFDDFRKELGYVDLLIADPKTEEIVYSVRKGVDLGADLANGPAADSKLAGAVRRIRDRNEPGAVEFVDFEDYVSSWWRPSMFVVTGLFRAEKLTGILILQISDEVLSRFVGGSRLEDTELGRTGEVYLVGTDSLVRSENRVFLKDQSAYLSRLRQTGLDASMPKRLERAGTAILTEKRHPENFGEAFATRKGTAKARGTFGQSVVVSFERLDLGGLPWGIVAQMDTDEATAWTSEFRAIALSSILASCLLAGFVSYFAARALIRPLRQLNRAARAFTNGFYEVRLPVESEDEIGDLATGLDTPGVFRKTTRRCMTACIHPNSCEACG